MKKYFVKTPWWLKRIYSSYTWSIPAKEKIVYLSFDDGPHPVATPFVLDLLTKYRAKATFFCIGKNVMAYPDIYRRILDEGHAVGNHTQNHLNGWKTKDAVYLADISEAAKLIDSGMFRPPYGRISSFQAAHIAKAMKNDRSRVVMWDILSGDFDNSLSGKQCSENVVLNVNKGSIIVFHDSGKAFPRLEICLPEVMKFLEKEKYVFAKLTEN
jgi:peptidoglycan/xylan/chitin deacetylase (PgdA/CDA1 family)